MKRVLGGALLVVALAAGAADLPTEHLPDHGDLAVGAKSPWISGWTLDGQVWNLKKAFADESTRRTVLVFWATWCGPCKQGLRELTAAADGLAAAGVQTVLVNLDQDQATVERFLAANPMPFTCILDPFQTSARRYFGVDDDGPALTLPRTVLLAPDRTVEAILGREGDDYLAILLAE